MGSAVPIKFSANTAPGVLLGIQNRLYKKIKGRAYRSYWLCIEMGCSGQIMVNDLKGGEIVEITPHDKHCMKSFNKKKNQI